MEDEDFIRVYMDGGHIPGIPGFFPAGIPVRIDERTNTVLPDESPPALPETDEQEEQLSQSEQVLSSQAEQQPAENVTIDTNQEQGEALPVNPILNLGMLGGN